MVRRGVLAALGAVILLIPAAAGHAEPRDDYFERLTAAVRGGLDRLAAARAPTLVPPVPFAVRWKPSRLASVELGAPLLALTSGDLDADGKAELYAVTSRELIALGLSGRKVQLLGKLAFTGAYALPAPRDPVGTVVIEGSEIVAGASPWAGELRARWTDGVLVAAPAASAAPAGFTVCPGERQQLAPGRNHYGDPATPLYGVRCRTDLVDPAGHPLRLRGTVTGTTLEISVEKCAAGGRECQPLSRHEYKDYGVAFELADVDRDGRPEVIVTGAGAPGDPDAVKVITLGGDEKKGLFRRAFNGGVAGVAVLDGDGDGKPEVMAAVRLVGGTRVDLWRLD